MTTINKVSLLILILVLCKLSALAQHEEDSIPRSSEGKFFIMNWIPPEDQSGPILSQTSLDYSFWIVNGELAQRFNLQYYLGDYFIKDGVRYSRKEIGDSVFNEMRIKNITFKAKVFSGGEYKTDLIIEYPEISAKSGGKSGWYTIKGIDWDEVFLNIEEAEAKEIFEEGFELKDCEILYVKMKEDEETEKVVDELEEEELAEEKERKEKISAALTSDGSQSEKEKRKVKFSESKFVSFILDYDPGKSSKQQHMPWWLNFGIGGNYTRFPINANITTHEISNSSVDVNHTTVKELGGGYNLALRGSYWPILGQYFGIGIDGGFIIGGIPKLYNSSYNFHGAEFRIQSFAGDRKGKFLMEFGKKMRYGVYFSQNATITPTMEVHDTGLSISDFSVNRVGVGARFWLTVPDLRILDIKLLFDYLKLPYDSPQWYSTISVEMWRAKHYRFALDITPQYPIIGENLYSAEIRDDKGVRISFTLTKELDFFGKPHFLEMNRGRKIWK